MLLSVFERLSLAGIVPRAGDITTLRIVRELERELSFSEEELKALQFKHEDGNIRWNPEADVLKDVPIGDVGKKIIKDALVRLSESKKLTMDLFGLYERFVEGVEEKKVIQFPTPSA